MAEQLRPAALLWVDIEATNILPEVKDGILDYSEIEIMEFAAIITDFNLDKIEGYQEVVQMNAKMANQLRDNDFVLNMHRGSGLVQACMQSTHTVGQIEEEVLQMMEEVAPGQVFQIAGSGVAAYDHPLIRGLMPKLSKRLHYAPYDVGVLRRTSKTMAGQDIVNIPRSYQDGVKTHRAWDDVEAHLEEGQRFQQFFRHAVSLGAVS